MESPNNPYAPPKARELELPHALPERCRHVESACVLLWIGFGLAVVISLVAIFTATDASARNEAILGEVIALVIVFALTYWSTVKLRAGRNWMRLLFTIVTAAGFGFLAILVIMLLSSASGYGFFSGVYEAAPIESIAMLLQLILSAAQVILLNTPDARAWFAARKFRTVGGS